jgi:hypothetical protein
VLRELAVSVTLNVNATCDSEWWLTCESGDAPRCVDTVRCGCTREEDSVLIRRRAYIVLCVHNRVCNGGAVGMRPITIVLLLSSQRVRMVSLYMVQELRLLASGGMSVPMFQAKVERGWFCSEGCRGCSVQHTVRCSGGCTEVLQESRTMVVQDCYKGASPCSWLPWFGGVTDAAARCENDTGRKCQWLQCMELSS